MISESDMRALESYNALKAYCKGRGVECWSCIFESEASNCLFESESLPWMWQDLEIEK